MSPIPQRRRARHWLAGLAALTVAPPAFAQSDGATVATRDEQLALSVVYNGTAASEAIVVRRRGDSIWMAANDLRALGIAVPPGQPQVALRSIRGLGFAIDDATQTLTMTFGPLAKQRLRAAGPATSDDTPVTPNGWGATLNYDVSATWRGRRAALGGFVDGAVYAPGGYAFASAIVSTDRYAATRRVQRLDTGMTFADPAALRRITAGDFINRSLSFTRPVRMIGAQLTTDFALRPDLVTFPVPVIDAQASVPSAIDLVVNGSRQSAGDVKAGAFAVTDVPVQTGLNTISVAVRDALGRERVQTLTTYTSVALLAPGLDSYALEGGFLRTGYGTAADRYGDVAVSGGWRRGITAGLTLEGHAEGSRDLVDGGVGAVVSLDRFGLVGASVAGSRSAGRTGGQLMVSWERIARPVSLSARLTVNSPDWRDLAARSGAVTRGHTLIVNASLDAGGLGSLSGSLIDLGGGRVTPIAADGRPLGVTRSIDPSTFAVATWSGRIAQRFNLVASGGGDLRRSGSLYASAGLLLTFGSRTSGYAGLLARGGGLSGRADLTRSALTPGDLGYSASIGAGGIDRLAGGVEYLGTAGHYDIQAERIDGATAFRASARGSLIVAEGGVFASDQLTGSFAIVDTDGEPNVPIYRDNRRIGATNARGKLLVANLPPYEKARIAFDPDELPIDASVTASDATVKPAERAGVRVDFGIYRNSAMALRVTMAWSGMPVGTSLSVNDFDTPMGFDGEVYLHATRAVNHLVARLPSGAVCEASFARPRDYAVGSPPVDIICLPRPIATAQR